MSSKYKGIQISVKDEILDVRLQLSRPLEIILNLNSDGTEQDPNTRINENTNTVIQKDKPQGDK